MFISTRPPSGGRSKINIGGDLDENSNEIARIETSFPDIAKGNVGYITATTKKDIAIAYELKIERK